MNDNYASQVSRSSGHDYKEYKNSGFDEFQASTYTQNTNLHSARDYLLIFRERIWYLIVAFFVIFTGSILYTVTKTKEYTAVATVQLLRDDPTPMQMAEGYEPNQILNSEDQA